MKRKRVRTLAKGKGAYVRAGYDVCVCVGGRGVDEKVEGGVAEGFNNCNELIFTLQSTSARRLHSALLSSSAVEQKCKANWNTMVSLFLGDYNDGPLRWGGEERGKEGEEKRVKRRGEKRLV